MTAAFSAHWQASKAIAMLAYRRRAAQGSNGMSLILLVLMFVLPFLAWMFASKKALWIGLGAAVPFGLLALMWWAFLVTSAIRQIAAPGARLLPHLQRRCMAVLVLVACAIVAIATVLLSLIGMDALNAAALTTLALATVPAFILLPLVRHAVLALIFLQATGLIAFDWLSHWLGQHIVAACMLMLALYALLALRRKQPGAARAVRHGAPPLYLWFLRRDCRAQDPAKLLLHAAGPAAHMPSAALSMVCYMALLAAGAAWINADSVWIAIAKFVVVALALCGQYAIAARVLAAITARANEQALFRLTELAPGAAAFNRQLARAMMRQYAVFWGASSLGALALLAAGAVDAVRLMEIAALFILNLMAAGMLLRHHAGRARKSGLAGAVLLLTVHALALLILSGALTMAPGLALLAMAFAASAIWLRHRWRAMVCAPVAFPAGRLG